MEGVAEPRPLSVPFGVNLGNVTHAIGFDTKARRNILRKTVDYSATIVRHLENRVWQRDDRDKSIIQPDITYFNEMVVPLGLEDNPVNAVTTKFVRACTNKVRCPIFCASWVPDGRRLITGANSGEFTLWNGINFNFESILQGHDCAVRSMAWSHNGVWMASTDDRGFIKYWQSNLNNVHTFQAHNEPVRCSSFSPTDSKLATCSDDGTVRVWDFIRCSEEFILRGHGADVKWVDWHPRRNLLVSGSKDNQQPVILWDPKAGRSVSTIHAHKSTVMSVRWNQNGNWLLTASRDSLIKLFDIRAMKEVYTLKGHKKEVNTLAWHPVHETLFASGGSDGAILFWLVGNEREVGGMESAHDSHIWSLAWHPLGHILCSASNDYTSKFWCRNRPGDELKDKYNAFVNPLLFSEEAPEIDVQGVTLPGMGASKQSRSSAISLPPPSTRRSPPPPPSTWNSGRGGSPPPGQRTDNSAKMGIGVPVLGADIIAEQFGGGRDAKPMPHGNQGIPGAPPGFGGDFPHRRGPLPMQEGKPLEPMRRGFNEPPMGGERWVPPHEQGGDGRRRPMPSSPIGQGMGGPGPDPLFQDGFRGPPPPGPRGREREWHAGGQEDFQQRENFQRGPPRPGLGPSQGPRPLYRPPYSPSGDFPMQVERNPYSWQRANYGRNRRPSEDESRFPEMPLNPYVYRRPEEAPPPPPQDSREMTRDPRQMDPRRAATVGPPPQGRGGDVGPRMEGGGWRGGGGGEPPRPWGEEQRRPPSAPMRRPSEEFPEQRGPLPHPSHPPHPQSRAQPLPPEDFERQGGAFQQQQERFDPHRFPPDQRGPPPPQGQFVDRRDNWAPHDRPGPPPRERHMPPPQGGPQFLPHEPSQPPRPPFPGGPPHGGRPPPAGRGGGPPQRQEMLSPHVRQEGHPGPLVDDRMQQPPQLQHQQREPLHRPAEQFHGRPPPEMDRPPSTIHDPRNPQERQPPFRPEQPIGEQPFQGRGPPSHQPPPRSEQGVVVHERGQEQPRPIQQQAPSEHFFQAQHNPPRSQHHQPPPPQQHRCLPPTDGTQEFREPPPPAQLHRQEPVDPRLAQRPPSPGPQQRFPREQGGPQHHFHPPGGPQQPQGFQRPPPPPQQAHRGQQFAGHPPPQHGEPPFQPQGMPGGHPPRPPAPHPHHDQEPPHHSAPDHRMPPPGPPHQSQPPFQHQAPPMPHPGGPPGPATSMHQPPPHMQGQYPPQRPQASYDRPGEQFHPSRPPHFQQELPPHGQHFDGRQEPPPQLHDGRQEAARPQSMDGRGEWGGQQHHPPLHPPPPGPPYQQQDPGRDRSQARRGGNRGGGGRGGGRDRDRERDREREREKGHREKSPSKRKSSEDRDSPQTKRSRSEEDKTKSAKRSKRK